jgi:hypothetical protein
MQRAASVGIPSLAEPSEAAHQEQSNVITRRLGAKPEVRQPKQVGCRCALIQSTLTVQQHKVSTVSRIPHSPTTPVIIKSSRRDLDVVQSRDVPELHRAFDLEIFLQRYDAAPCVEGVGVSIARQATGNRFVDRSAAINDTKGATSRQITTFRQKPLADDIENPKPYRGAGLRRSFKPVAIKRSICMTVWFSRAPWDLRRASTRGIKITGSVKTSSVLTNLKRVLVPTLEASLSTVTH